MAEVLHGKAGGDQINVSKNKTQVYGLAGNDTITNDGKSNVLLVGGSGDDKLIMKGGKGTLNGGAGKDTFELNYSATEKISVVIEDLDPSKDKIVVNFDGKTVPQLSSKNSGKDVIWKDKDGNLNVTLKSVRENDYFDGTASNEAWEVLKLTNAEREKKNLSPLTMSEGLTEGAQIRAGEITGLADRGALSSHDRPDNKGGYSTIFDDVDKHYFHFGENLDGGARSPSEVMKDWMNSSSHKDNILKENFHKLGVGYNYDDPDVSNLRWYWTQLFADSLKSAETVKAAKLLTADMEIDTEKKYVKLTNAADIYDNMSYAATIAAKGGDDSITNSSPKVSISGDKGNDIIDNKRGSNVTIKAGKGNDSINLASSTKEILIQYKNSDGNDTITGLNSTDTLSISGHKYMPVTVGNDVIVSVGANTITLLKAPKTLNIEGTRSKHFLLTEGNDNLDNIVDRATIEALGGKDKISNSGSRVSISGGKDEDKITNLGSKVTIVSGEGDDKVTNKGSSVTISGGLGDDKITNSGNYVTISGGKGNDSLVNKNGENVLFVYGSGLDTIKGFNSSSTLKVSSKNYSSIASGKDLILTSKSSKDSITILNALKLDSINVLYTDDNPVEVERIKNIFGTDDADSLNYNSDEIVIQALGGDDSIKSTGDNVSIFGGEGNDSISNSGSDITINGGKGSDSIKSRGDNNSISGGADDDTIEISGEENTINAGEGNDSIKVSGSKNLIEYVAGDGSDIIEGFNRTSTLSITDDFYTSATIDNDVVVTVGDDKISLIGAANLSKINIVGSSSDFLYYNEHSYRLFDEGMTWEEAKAYCESLGGHLVVITDADEQAAIEALLEEKGTKNSYWIGGFKSEDSNDNEDGDDSKVITLTEGDDTYFNTVEGAMINALGGNDSIVNESSDVSIDAGADDDVISLSSDASNNVFVYKAGDGNDTIYGLNESDNLQIGDGTENYSTMASGDDVIVKVGEGTITLKDARSKPPLIILGESGTSGGGSSSGEDGEDDSGSWQWVTGETWDYDNWGEGQPNGDGFALMMYNNANIQWERGDWKDLNSDGTHDEDTFFGKKNFGLICEWEKGLDSSKLILLTEGPDTYSESLESDTTLKALGGNDSIENSGDSVTIDLGANNDSINNYGHHVLIEGDKGNDKIYNYDGEDGEGNYSTLRGGTGNDAIDNHGKHVLIEGGTGDDTIWNNYRDLFSDGAEYTTIRGGAGDDSILNYGASALIYGGAGYDSIQNWGANVSIDSGEADDSILNESLGSNVIIKLGDGEDFISNNGSNVSIDAGEGEDFISNNVSNVSIEGGTGDDTIWNNYRDLFSDGAEYTTIRGGVGDDYIENYGASSIIDGGDGKNYIESYGANVTINSGTGSDSIKNYGNSVAINSDGGNDYIVNSSLASFSTINAAIGDDSIINGGASVIINGGEDNDTIINEGSDVSITGGAGDDIISLSSDSQNNFIQYTEGDGNDTIYGLDGNDKLQIGDGTGTYSTTSIGDDVIVKVGEGTITLKDFRDRPKHIIIGESGSSGGPGGNGGGSSDGNNGGGNGGSNSSGGTSGSSASNSAASGGRSASGSAGISSATSSGNGSSRGSTNTSRQVLETATPPVQTIRNQVIYNYHSGDKINFGEKHTGAFFDNSGNFYSGSTTGAVVIPDAMNKLIDLRDTAGNPFIKAYAASNAGVIDGRKLLGFEVINGSTGADDIYAGRNGAQMSGGYGNDTLTGGNGIDIFVTGKAQGRDLIRNASLLDKVNLTDATINDIISSKEDDGVISLKFRTGNVITIESKDILSPKITLSDGSAYLYNHASKSWRVTKKAPAVQNVYTGGEQIISNYKSGDEIVFNAEYKGASYDGEGNFNVNSSAGTLVVKNAVDKVVDLRNGLGSSFVKAYAASNAGVIDGRELTGYEIINGSAGSDVISAGNGGSQLWGGADNVADVLVGGSGADNFITGKAQGEDLIRNASSADTVNLNDSTLSDIIATSESNGTISLSFNTGNVVNVQSSELLSARFTLSDGSAYRYNHAIKSWQNA